MVERLFKIWVLPWKVKTPLRTREIGSGKTTLLLALLGFVPVTKGEIKLFGKVCRKEKILRHFVARLVFVFKMPMINFGPTVLDDIAFGPLNQNVPREQAYHIAEQQLERLGITRLKDRMVHTLSGGEKFHCTCRCLSDAAQNLIIRWTHQWIRSKNTEKLTALLRELSLPILISSHHHGFINELATEIISLWFHIH